MARASEQEADVVALEQLAERLDEDAYRARAAAARATFAVIAGDFEGAIRAARRVTELSELVPASTACFARIHWARAVQYLGNYTDARTHIEACLQLARRSGERRAERVAICQLGLIDAELGRFSSARRYFDEALATSRDSGDKTMQGILINNLASLEQTIGNYERARELLQAGLSLSEDVGDELTGGYALSNLAVVAMEQGNAAESRQFAAQGVESARALSAPDLEARALVILGDAQAKVGDLDEAAASYETSLALFARIGRPTMRLLPLSGLARHELQRGDTDAAMRHVVEIVAHVDRGDALDGLSKSQIYFDCFKVMAAAGHPRADEFLRLAYDEVTEQANQLEASERARFLDDVATNAAIVEAMKRRPDAGDDVPGRSLEDPRGRA
jgi:tetratricopeptide (TPR) repeat protein